MEIKAKISISEKDVMIYNFDYFKRSMMTGASLVFVGLFGFSFLLFRRIDVVTFIMPSVGVVVGVLTGAVCAFFGAKRTWKNNAWAGESGDCTFTDTGVNMESGSGTGRFEYGKLFRVYETPKAFYLYLMPRMALIMPKRCFDSTDDIQAVRELFRKNMDKKKLKLMKN